MNKQAQFGFDLANIASLAQVTHKCGVIFDEEGNPTAGFIMVGKNSPQYINEQNAIRVENLQRSAARKKDIDATKAEGAQVIIDKVEGNELRTACSVITGWFGFGQGGQEAEFDKDVVKQILEAAPQWKDKVLADLQGEANFMPGLSKD